MRALRWAQCRMSIELYPLLIHLHRASVTLSLSLFVARALGVRWSHAWPMAARWRWLSVAIDTVLLSAGASLWYILALHPLQQHWLGVKLMLVVSYIVLGSLALKRARSPRGKTWALLAACFTAFTIIGIALARAPEGWLRLL